MTKIQSFWTGVKHVAKTAWGIVRNPVGFACQFTAGAALVEAVVQAQTSMDTAVTTVSGYWTTIYPIGVAIVVFVVGRRIVKKL
jgi:hypothetical protein